MEDTQLVMFTRLDGEWKDVGIIYAEQEDFTLICLWCRKWQGYNRTELANGSCERSEGQVEWQHDCFFTSIKCLCGHQIHLRVPRESSRVEAWVYR